MAKVLIIIVLIAAAAFLLYRGVDKQSSDEVRMVKAAESRFEMASAKYMRIGKTSGMLASSAVEESETAVNSLKQIKNEFDHLKSTLTDDKAVSRAARLSDRIEEFFFKNDIN